MACERGHLDVVKTLLGAGADVNIATINADVSIFVSISFYLHPITLPFCMLHVHTCITCIFCSACACMRLYN